MNCTESDLEKQMIRRNVSSVIKYLRQRESYSQDKISKLLGCPRTTYMRLENGQKDLMLYEWKKLKEIFQITDEELELGYVERGRDDSYLFNLPDCYSEASYTKGRLLSLLVTYFKSTLGDKAFEEFCKRERVPSTFFTNLSNSINIRFSLRLYQELIKKRKLVHKSQLQDFARVGLRLRPHHGEHLSEYKGVKGIRKLSLLLSNISDLEENHDYVLEDMREDFSQITISFWPKEHVDKSLYIGDPILKTFMKDWISTYFEIFSESRLKVINKEDYFVSGGKNTFIYKAI
jgi:transcriptional regulator with XRE-family HTH domain